MGAYFNCILQKYTKYTLKLADFYDCGNVCVCVSLAGRKAAKATPCTQTA